MRTVAVALFGILFSLSLASSVAANPYYYGQWKYNNCNLFLKGDMLGSLSAETQWCDGDWAFAQTWRTTANGIQVLNNLNRVIATLTSYGDQLSFTATSGNHVVFSRVGGRPAGGSPSHGGAPRVGATPFTIPPFTIAPPFGGAPVQNRPAAAGVGPPHSFAVAWVAQRGGCVYRGKTQTCASQRDLGMPLGIPINAELDGRSAWITLVGGPSFRPKIGFDQPILFYPANGYCIPVYACYERADTGPWCVTRLNGKQGYMSKFGRRPDQSLYVNFVNGCEPGAPVGRPRNQGAN